MAPRTMIERFKERIALAPGLPNPNPTTSAWQQPPDSIANIQSPDFPQDTDVVIIGSGVTGCGVAHTLLNHPAGSNLRVIILEARSAVSGATGRNGGHIVSDTAGHFQSLVDGLGVERAVQILRFSEANILRLKELAAQLEDKDRDAAELRSLISTSIIMDRETLEPLKQSLKLLKEAVTSCTLEQKVIEDQDAFKDYRYKGGVAVFEQHGAGALWPYRLLTAVLRYLLRDYPDRFSLETNTPATSIVCNGEGYVIETPRGSIKAKKVIHCTNGHATHLLPQLTGRLYPLRGTMSVHSPGPAFPQLGSVYSWTQMQKHEYDPETGRLSPGLYYAQQNAHTGDIWIGGENQSLETMLSSDDSVISDQATENLSSIIPRVFVDTEGTEMKKIWSGIMGFTADGLPFIGKLGPAVTDRTGDGEWIAAGFNGHGMDKAWLSGEAVARMVLGEEVPDWLPAAYLLDEKRLEICTMDFAAEQMAAIFPSA
ncbi:putative oxidoreductase ordL [Ilyonectria robusta]